MYLNLICKRTIFNRILAVQILILTKETQVEVIKEFIANIVNIVSMDKGDLFIILFFIYINYYNQFKYFIIII
jgi:hypothetical protein